MFVANICNVPERTDAELLLTALRAEFRREFIAEEIPTGVRISVGFMATPSGARDSLQMQMIQYSKGFRTALAIGRAGQ